MVLNWPMRNRSGKRQAYVLDGLGLPLRPSWSTQLAASVLAPPVAGGGRIFVCSVDALWAIDAKTGKPIWKFECPKDAGPELNAFKSSPTLVGAYVFVSDMRGQIFKLDRGSGELTTLVASLGARDESFCATEGRLFSRFSQEMDGESTYGYMCIDPDLNPLWFFRSEGPPTTMSCASSEGRLVFGDRTGFLYCLETGTGAEIWRVDLKPHIDPPASPSPLVRQDPIPRGLPMIIADTILVRGGGNLIGIDLSSGQVRWSRRPDEGLNKVAPADCLAVDDEYLYFMVGGHIRKLTVHEGKEALSVEHVEHRLGGSRSLHGLVVGGHYVAGFNDSRSLVAFDTSDGHIAWRFNGDAGFREAAIWMDDALFVTDDRARLRCFEAGSSC